MIKNKSTPPALLHCLYARIPEDKIVMLKYFLEGYDGLATLSTVDYISSLVSLRYYPDNRMKLISLLETSHDIIGYGKTKEKH